jgi:hypothetical protein
MRTTVMIQNMYAYHCNNTKYVCVPLGAENISVYFQDTGLSGCFDGWQVWNLETRQPAEQGCRNLKFRDCCVRNLTQLDDRRESEFMFEQRSDFNSSYFNVVSWPMKHLCVQWLQDLVSATNLVPYRTDDWVDLTSVIPWRWRLVSSIRM